ncbi:hypothetical protein D3C80_1464140 [compost metagenome]
MGRHVADLRGRAGADGEDGDRADQRTDRGAQRVEGLGHVQPGGGGFRPAEDVHVGVGRHLQQGHARGEDEQRGEEERIGLRAGRRIEQQAAEAGGGQADDDPALVAEAFDQAPGGEGHDEVGGEEAELDQRGLHIGEGEHRLQVRDEDVVQRSDQAPHEEQQGQYREGAGVAVLVRLVHGLRGSCAV